MRQMTSEPTATTYRLTQNASAQPELKVEPLANWWGTARPIATYVKRWMACHVSYGQRLRTAAMDVMPTMSSRASDRMERAMSRLWARYHDVWSRIPRPASEPWATVRRAAWATRR